MESTYSAISTPPQIVAANMNAAKSKTELSLGRMILLGIFAGMFIAGGASASSLAMHAISNVGLARLVAGTIFPVGLMMIVLVGGELFTGDCLMIMGCVHGKFSVFKMVKVLIVVYLSNLVGSLLFAGLVYASGQYNYTNGMLGAFTIKVALGKVNLSFGAAVASGILCNIFVCMAVLMATAARDISGKIWGIFFPILTFIVSGYEHCVANMYYIPAGIFAAANEAYVTSGVNNAMFAADQLANLNWVNFVVKNLIPVTIGNILGGMVFVGLPLYLIHEKKLKAGEGK